MAAASRALDPIAVAQADIAGSKHLIASVARDLSQHERWLAHYQLAEKRHARRLMIHAVLARLELARLRLTTMLRRLALRTWRFARIAGNFLWQTTTAILFMLARAAAAGEAWLRPRLITLALILQTWLALAWVWGNAAARRLALAARKQSIAFSAWALAQSRMAARVLQRGLAAFWVWAVAKSRILAHVSREWLAAFVAWTTAKARASGTAMHAWSLEASVWVGSRSKTVANATEKRIKRGWNFAHRNSHAFLIAAGRGASAAAVRAGAQSRALTFALKDRSYAYAAWTRQHAVASFRSSVALASAACSQTVSNLRRLMQAEKRVTPPQAHSRALTLRRSTALICIEPCRTRLPAIRAG